MTEIPTRDRSARLAEIERKLANVKAALRDNEVDVFNPEHHASWDDIEWLLAALRAVEEEQGKQTDQGLLGNTAGADSSEPAPRRDA